MAAIDWAAQDEWLVVTFQGEGRFNPETLTLVNQALDQLEADASRQALLFTGQDKHFCLGLDLEYLMSATPEEAMGFVHQCMAFLGRVLTAPVPTVVALNGHAFGLGAMLTLASDYRVMRADRGFFCLPEVDMGTPLMPSMNALVQAKLSGSLLRDVLLTGRRIGGVEATQRGLIDQCVEADALLPVAQALAQPMMGKGRQVLAQMKHDLHRSILQVIEEGSR